MNWTRDRVRRLTRISESAAALSADLQSLIHELGAEDTGKEQLAGANEALHQAELEIHETLERAQTIWELSAALAEFAPPYWDETGDRIGVEV